jgi:Flp pilus assembly protein TadD
LIVTFAGIVPYFQTLQYPFVWDDEVFVERNEAIRTLSSPSRFFLDPSTLASKKSYQNKIYRPLRTMGWAGLYGIFGLNPFGFHLLNLLLHLGCSVLVFKLATTAGLSLRGALFAGALFAVHPVHTEAVTWVSSFADVLSTFFYLLATITFLQGRRGWRFAAVFVIFPLALFSKEMAITWPAILVVLSICAADRPAVPRGKAAVGWCAAAFGVAGLYFAFRAHVLGSVGQNELALDGFLQSVGRIPLVFRDYLVTLFFPVELNSLRPAIRLSEISHFEYGIALTIILGAVGIGGWGCLRRKKGAFWAAWYLVTLLPVLNLIPVIIHVAERFIYLPSVAFCIGGGLVLEALRSRFPGTRAIYPSAVAILLALIFATALRNTVWEDDLAIALEQVSHENLNPNGYWNLGNVAAKKGDWPLAISAFNKLLKYDPNKPKTLNNLAYCLLKAGKFQESESLSRRSLEQDPHDVMAYNNLGAAMMSTGRFEEAAQAFLQALKLNPDYLKAQLNLGLAQMKLGKKDQAKKTFRKAKEMHPSNPEVKRLLKRLYGSNKK